MSESRPKLSLAPHSTEARGSESEYVHALRFRWLTRLYDLVVQATTRERAFKRALIRQARIETDQRVLDIGCGTGTLALWIKQTVPQAEVFGVDGDLEMLSIARNKAKRIGAAVHFDQAFSFALPYADREFDRAVSSLFFHHLSWRDKQRTVREIARVLRPGAELHIADWGKATSILMRCLFFLVQAFDGFENTRDNVAGRLPELFEEAGFIEVSVERTFSTMFGTMTLYRAKRR